MSLEFEFNQKIKRFMIDQKHHKTTRDKITKNNEALNSNSNTPCNNYDMYIENMRLQDKCPIENKMDYFNSIAGLINDYYKTDNKFDCLQKYKESFNTSEVVIQTCSQCGSKLTFDNNSNGSIQCPSCGMVVNNVQFHDSKSSSDMGQNKYSYKRVIHFVDKLRKIQACENTKIPQEIYDTIRNECKKEHIDIRRITIDKIRIYLAKFHYSKYYDNVYQIYKHLTNKTIVNKSENIEVQLVNKFMQVEEVYDTVILANNKSRTNFINYKYILFKLCQMLGHSDIPNAKEYLEYTKYIQLSKNKMKLQQIDILWKQICEILKWNYLPSI